MCRRMFEPTVTLRSVMTAMPSSALAAAISTASASAPVASRLAIGSASLLLRGIVTRVTCSPAWADLPGRLTPFNLLPSPYVLPEESRWCLSNGEMKLNE